MRFACPESLLALLVTLVLVGCRTGPSPDGGAGQDGGAPAEDARRGTRQVGERCTAHSECAEGLCRLGRDGPVEGTCVAEREIVFVAQKDPACTDDRSVPGAGTRAVPYCKLNWVMAGDRRIVAVYPGDYRSDEAAWQQDRGAYEIYGLGPGVVLSGDKVGVKLNSAIAAPPVSLTLVDVTVAGAGIGVSCTVDQRMGQAELYIYRSQIVDSRGKGAEIRGCKIQIEDSQFLRNGDGALWMSAARYLVARTRFESNTSKANAAVLIDQDCVLLSSRQSKISGFLSNSLIGNKGPEGVAGAVECRRTPDPVYLEGLELRDNNVGARGALSGCISLEPRAVSAGQIVP